MLGALRAPVLWTPFGRLQPGFAGLLARRARSYDASGPFLRRVDDADKLPVFRALAFELHKSVFLGEQCVIAAETNIYARMDSCATLTNNNISGNNLLAAEDFDA